MSRSTDVRAVGASLWFLPVEMRVPLKFGAQTIRSLTCARASMTVEDRWGRRATGWGETPLSVQWAWPSDTAYERRHDMLRRFCERLAERWAGYDHWGHPVEIGHAFQCDVLPPAVAEINGTLTGDEHLPWLAALIACSPFDIALHDAYGKLHGTDVYHTYTSSFMNDDLSAFLEPAKGGEVEFTDRYPADYFVDASADRLAAWHLVGGLDLLDDSQRTGDEPDDGHPVTLVDWIRRDGLTCLKIKLRGNDARWDYQRLMAVGRIGLEHHVRWLSADFNCTVTDPVYVNDILDRLRLDQPRVFDSILYVEQPFPYDLERYQIDVHSVSKRKPLFMDESAHDWRLILLGRELGWTGVALKTCKTQTEALLSACWAKAHGMALMVQDLTNPMLAQIPHVRLAAHVGTIAGVETNAPQFYPDVSRPEEAVHTGLYRRRNGCVDLSTIAGPGFGYRFEEIDRRLPEPAVCFGA